MEVQQAVLLGLAVYPVYLGPALRASGGLDRVSTVVASRPSSYYYHYYDYDYDYNYDYD